jgi:hypothetical protein
MLGEPILPTEFRDLYNRVNNSIRIIASVLLLGYWARSVAAPVFVSMIERTAGRLKPAFPNIAEQALYEKVEGVALEYHQEACGAIDSAVLVFSHSVADSAADELLDLSARSNPSEWLSDNEEFKMTLRDLTDTPVAEFQRQARARLVQRHKGKNLPAKIICWVRW